MKLLICIDCLWTEPLETAIDTDWSEIRETLTYFHFSELIYILEDAFYSCCVGVIKERMTIDLIWVLLKRWSIHEKGTRFVEGISHQTKFSDYQDGGQQWARRYADSDLYQQESISPFTIISLPKRVYCRRKTRLCLTDTEPLLQFFTVAVVSHLSC